MGQAVSSIWTISPPLKHLTDLQHIGDNFCVILGGFHFVWWINHDALCTLCRLKYDGFLIGLPISGAATIRIEMPGHMENSLIFHYNLKFYGNDKDSYEGVSLKR